MSSKQFVGTIKTVKLSGDYPDLEVQSAQAELPLEPADEPGFEQAQAFIGEPAPEAAARA